MENVWRVIKYKLRNMQLGTTAQLQAAIHKAWKELPKKLAEKLLDSMPNRMQRVLEEKGDSIDY
jgi:hypothetical protein